MKEGRTVLIFLLNVAGIIVFTILLAPLAMPVIDFLSSFIPSLPRVLDAHKYPGGYDYARVWRTVNQIVMMVFLLANMRRMGFTSLPTLGFPVRTRWKPLLSHNISGLCHAAPSIFKSD